MKKLLLILWIFFTSLVYGKSGTVSVPLYVDLDTNIAIPTKAKIITTRIPVYQNITNIEKELKSFPQIKNAITSIFTALQSQNLDKLKDCHRPQDANLAQDLLQRFTAKGLDVNTVKILDIFFLDNKTIQFFYEIMHNKTGTKRVAYFTLQKNTNNGVFYRVKKSPTPLESLFSYSVLQHHHSNGKFASEKDTKIPLSLNLILPQVSLLPLKLLSVDSTIKAFYDAYIEARNSGDVIMLPSFYSEKSREKVNQLIKNNMYELGEKYDSRRRYNNTILLGMVSLDPIYIIVEQVNPRKDEYYYKYTIIIKDSQGNPQIVNVLFESFLDDLLRQYGITPQFL